MQTSIIYSDIHLQLHFCLTNKKFDTKVLGNKNIESYPNLIRSYKIMKR